ncbi:PUA-like domain-containing protein [Ephemerocybe angulata]|uniref:PUA-like domain-containing protein n=1 Tax=Ephemerocybe angulata TaxID=980116 RepID=A0A8H6MAC7_9AGAR|nr:PUA-like domain-containing protein [Tulosesus angulatus]
MGFLKRSIKNLQKRDPTKIGAIKGVELFSKYASREDLFIEGVHGVAEGGIHGRANEGAFSIVVAGRYDDDDDRGEIIYYTGEGGHSRSSELQIKDQEWVRGNAALRTSKQRNLPVRVIRSHVLRSRYAPASGYRYDGLYKVIKAEQIVGNSGHAVCRFILEVRTLVPHARQGSLPGDDGDVKRPVASSSRPPVSSSSTSSLPRRDPVLAAPKRSIAKMRKGKARESAEIGGIQFKYEGGTSPVKTEPVASSFGLGIGQRLPPAPAPVREEPTFSVKDLYKAHPVPGFR